MWEHHWKQINRLRARKVPLSCFGDEKFKLLVCGACRMVAWMEGWLGEEMRPDIAVVKNRVLFDHPFPVPPPKGVLLLVVVVVVLKVDGFKHRKRECEERNVNKQLLYRVLNISYVISLES